MKKWMLWALLLALLLPQTAFALEDKLPDAFQVKYKVSERKINGDRSFVYKEYVTTARADVDEAVNAIVDAFDEEYAPQLEPDKSKKPKRNSRLDIHVVHTVSGESCVSFLILARDTYNRVQRQSPFTTRVYDMNDGHPVALSDIIAEDGGGWQAIAQAVREQLTAYFPGEEPPADVLDTLCARGALKRADFMLGPVCLTLHYEAKVLYPDHPTLMQVRIPYSALRGMLTEYGEKQTNNLNYKMVALTFDDGPSYTNTAVLLNNLRHAGAQATFFLLGELIEEYPDITMRENDELHSLQSHTYKHTNPAKSSKEKLLAAIDKFYTALTGTVGTAPIMLRAPYGEFEPFVKLHLDLGLINWSVDTKDWTGKSSSAVLSTVKKEVKPGAIILMHDIKEKTPESGKQAAEWLFEHGYLCVTVQDLFLRYEKEMVQSRVYYSVSETTNEK